MSFASRIDAIKTAGNLVVGWQLQTVAQLDEIRRSDSTGWLTRFVADPNVRLESPYGVKVGWNSGSDANIPYGDIGGLGRFGFKEFKVNYGSPGVNHRFGRNDTMCLQWAERYNEALIGLGSCTDTGFKGPGVKTMMIDYERGRVEPGLGTPTVNLQGYTTNQAGEIVITSGSGAPTTATRHPTLARQSAYYSGHHVAFSNTTTMPRPLFRPEKWVVYTVQVDLGDVWTLPYASWQLSADPSEAHYILNDYRNTDARWIKSTSQQAAIDAEDPVALFNASLANAVARVHRFRMWQQYEDWVDPVQTHDAMFRLPNPYMWGGDEDPTEANFGQANYATLCFGAGANSSTLINFYGDRYTPYLQGKRFNDPFPDRFGPAATWPITKWYDSIIVSRAAIDPKFFGADEDDPIPPTPPASVTIPVGITVGATP